MKFGPKLFHEFDSPEVEDDAENQKSGNEIVRPAVDDLVGEVIVELPTGLGDAVADDEAGQADNQGSILQNSVSAENFIG
jgi:hypothetical protein